MMRMKSRSKYSLMQPRWLALHVIGIAGAVLLGKAWGDSDKDNSLFD